MRALTGIVVIPTYNERDNLPTIVPAILAHDGLRVLIVDDRSPDGTAEVAEGLVLQFPGRVEVLRRRPPRSMAGSFLDGFRRALESDADVIVQMDADLSHDPRYLPALIDEASCADVVLGSRYLDGISVTNLPLARIVLSVAANQYVRWVTRLPLTDCTSGYRCWRRQVLEQLPLERIMSNGYSFQVETLYRARQRGCRISEIPIVFAGRQRGSSKMSARIIIESLFLPWMLLCVRR